ncbi:hypothetical protein BJ138DRAFT_1165123 [Hygrophoropsis aurantiaca]|uniref:Uncharacterized protein n=1 Tax=Hygrophoropsis aurantiaca TaxID=72124 RepID=A0ACB7ZW45_9AGAM|nr:hypothetical protein BJ138DRAFT_1165123 [Hygrophoropsis aurantiaca]
MSSPHTEHYFLCLLTLILAPFWSKQSCCRRPKTCSNTATPSQGSPLMNRSTNLRQTASNPLACSFLPNISLVDRWPYPVVGFHCTPRPSLHSLVNAENAHCGPLAEISHLQR